MRCPSGSGITIGKNEEIVIKANTIGRYSNLSIVFTFIAKGVRFLSESNALCRKSVKHLEWTLSV